MSEISLSEKDIQHIQPPKPLPEIQAPKPTRKQRFDEFRQLVAQAPKEYVNKLTPIQREVIDARLSGESLGKIAERRNTSRQAILDAQRNAEQVLKGEHKNKMIKTLEGLYGPQYRERFAQARKFFTRRELAEQLGVSESRITEYTKLLGIEVADSSQKKQAIDELLKGKDVLE